MIEFRPICSMCKHNLANEKPLKIFEYDFLKINPTLIFTPTVPDRPLFSITQLVQPVMINVHNRCFSSAQKTFYTSHKDSLFTSFSKNQQNVPIFTYKNKFFSPINFTAIKLEYNIKKLNFNDTLTAQYFLCNLIHRNNKFCNIFINAIQNQLFKFKISQYFQHIKTLSFINNSPKLHLISDIFKKSSAFQFSIIMPNTPQNRQNFTPEQPSSLTLAKIVQTNSKKNPMLGQIFPTSQNNPPKLPPISKLFNTLLPFRPFPIFHAKNFKK